ncbi:hypothetical protein HPB51_027043 [Rhipicephalus microplus]|uniref:HMG box domain-containing protein n=1 Tax=Rhipicephalus microplus TaxID=6941 RepID=A0A9J6D1B7_RHIMP|nr:hypothetical protein HPB51_027043 [Rhipicephalus microplus]
MGPFCFLLRELQNERRERNFTCTLETVRAEAGKMWKSLTEEEKAHYEFMANRYKEKQVGSLRTASRLMGVALHMPTSYHQLKLQLLWIPPDGREGHDKFLNAYRTFFSEQTPLVDADATFSFSEVYRKAVMYFHEEAIYHCTIEWPGVVWFGPVTKYLQAKTLTGSPSLAFELATPDCRAVV